MVRNMDRGMEHSTGSMASHSQVLIVELTNGRDMSDRQVVTVRCTGKMEQLMQCMNGSSAGTDDVVSQTGQHLSVTLRFSIQLCPDVLSSLQWT